MNIRIIYIATGMVMGDVTESFEGELKLTNPCFLQMTAQGMQMLPLIAGTVEDYIVLNKKDIVFKNVEDYSFTPMAEIIKEYNRMFNLTQIVTSPDKKLILPQ